MREILFRGKTKDGVWYHGFIKGKSLPNYEGNKMEFTPCIIEQPFADIWVIPETVGQYTGLTDKNGRKIFEGDIVKCSDETHGYGFTAIVMFGNPNGEYNWGFQLKRIKGASANTDILLWVDMEETGAFIEVIGNIHDNPELLKGE